MSDKVLIIDDEPAIARILAMRLRRAGHEVVMAESGATGLVMAVEERPVAILLDIRMPSMDGFEVNRRLKEAAETRGIDVVFLSANVQDSARDAALSAGGRAFISKPFDHVKVVETLESLRTNRKAS